MKKLFLLLLAMMMMLPATAFAAADKPLSEGFLFQAPPESMTVGDEVEISFTALQGESLASLQLTTSDEDVLGGYWDDESGILTLQANAEGEAEIEITADGYAAEQVLVTVAEEEDEYSQEIIDLIDYLNMVAPLDTLENKAVMAYNRLQTHTAAHRKSAYAQLDGVIIPAYSKFVGKLKAVQAPNEELRKIHKGMVDGAKLQLEGFQLLKTAIYKKTSLSPAKNKIAAGLKLVDQHMQKLEAYADKYGY